VFVVAAALVSVVAVVWCTLNVNVSLEGGVVHFRKTSQFSRQSGNPTVVNNGTFVGDGSSSAWRFTISATFLHNGLINIESPGSSGIDVAYYAHWRGNITASLTTSLVRFSGTTFIYEVRKHLVVTFGNIDYSLGKLKTTSMLFILRPCLLYLLPLPLFRACFMQATSSFRHHLLSRRLLL
jgi:hypothetical protein